MCYNAIILSRSWPYVLCGSGSQKDCSRARVNFRSLTYLHTAFECQGYITTTKKPNMYILFMFLFSDHIAMSFL